MKLRPLVVTLALLATLAFAGSSSAAIRYAAPGGPGGVSTSCNPTACSLEDALDSTKTVDGDVVYLDTGTYIVSNFLTVLDNIQVRGTGAPSSTKIISTYSGSYPLFMDNPNASLHDFELDTSGNGTSLFVTRGTVDHLIVHNTSNDACGAGSAIFNETLCWTDGNGSSAIKIDWTNGTHNPAFYGVTAVATNPAGGYGINLTAQGTETLALEGTSMIASGATADIRTEQIGINSYVEAGMSYSNYDTIDSSAGGVINGLDDGPAHTQSAAPIFVNPLNNFREAECSPTINSGTTGAGSSPTDLGGLLRSTGGAPDIGAYEFDGIPGTCGATTPPPAAPLPVPDTTKPILKITKKPKAKSTATKIKVSFKSNEAGSTFMCKLDKGKAKKCKSPYKKTVKPGKHKLKIYAIDAAGNKSSTKEIGWLTNKK